MNPDQPPHPGWELHRLCRFSLALTCGHRVTVDVNGWYPVRVPCCTRLGGTILGGLFVPHSPEVEYVEVIQERYEWRPPASAREPMQVIDRMPRSDPPRVFLDGPSAGRFPQYVGAVWVLDRKAT